MPRRSGADELLLKVFTTARTQSAHHAEAPRHVLRELRNPLRQQNGADPGRASVNILVHQVLRLIISRCEKHGPVFVRGSRRELMTHLLHG